MLVPLSHCLFAKSNSETREHNKAPGSHSRRISKNIAQNGVQLARHMRDPDRIVKEFVDPLSPGPGSVVGSPLEPGGGTMAIVSGFVREERTKEIAGCPLGPFASKDDESSCTSCPYNVLNPGQPRMGCALNTPALVYKRCLAHLKLISKDVHDEFTRMLETERQAETDPIVQSRAWSASCASLKIGCLSWEMTWKNKSS